MMLSPEEIERRCGHHPADEERLARHERVRAIIRLAVTELNDVVPPCPELAIAFDRLDEVRFWANEGLARRDVDSTPPGGIGA